MTIAAAYLVSDGVVLGADSTTTISNQSGVTQLLNHAQKVFEIGEPGKGRFGIATWGAGSYASVSHRTIVARAADQIAANDGVTVAKDKFVAIALQEAQAAFSETDSVGYFFGGIDPNTKLPECWEILIVGHAVTLDHQLQLGEAKFGGAPQVFARLFHGHDPGLANAVCDQLCQDVEGLPQDFAKQFHEAFNKAVAQFAFVGYPDKPIRDAIDNIYMYLFSTVKAYKIRTGPPPCGGRIEIGFITADRPFRWACHKGFDTAVREHDGL